MKHLLSGNEAVARGAFDAGVRFAAAYPGTPSTEILETISKEYHEIKSEWAVNEKVALEVGIGASLAGARVLVAMKHVGVNVAADPLLTLAYTGINGGLVLITADDPGMHSSQNEQDNRRYAVFAKVPMLEPSDSQEVYDFMRYAYKISEKFDIPVMVRLSTRISHAKTLVKLSPPEKINLNFNFKKDTKKYVMIPAHARIRHEILEKKILDLQKYSDSFKANQIISGSNKNKKDIGIISSGVDYQYASEVFDGYPFLKISMIYPFPEKIIKKFAKGKKKLIIIESLEPYLEEYIQRMGLDVQVIGKEKTGFCGELSVESLREVFKIKGTKKTHAAIKDMPQLPVRSPILCPGCGHRGIFYVLKKLKCIVMGDIGCYTLGTLPPLEAMDFCVCMGASIGSAAGMSAIYDLTKSSDKTKNDKQAPQVNITGVIGDSTFVHSGITGLIDAIYNKRNVTFIILDNSTTAMTGHQEHPGTGKTIMGEDTVSLDYVKLAQSLGASYTVTIDPYDIEKTEEVLKDCFSRQGVKVVIAKRYCIQLKTIKPSGKIARIVQDKCKFCKLCLKVGCPAIVLESNKIVIDELLCTGCGICIQVCPFGAIEKV